MKILLLIGLVSIVLLMVWPFVMFRVIEEAILDSSEKRGEAVRDWKEFKNTLLSDLSAEINVQWKLK